MSGLHYKLSKKTKKLSAIKIDFSPGVKTPLMKALNETEEDMQTVTFSKKQSIAKLVFKRIDRITKEYQFID